MTFRKYTASIIAVMLIILSGCSNETQTITSALPESSIQAASQSASSMKVTEETERDGEEEATASNLFTSTDNKRLPVESSSQDMYLEKSDGGVRIFVGSNYYECKINAIDTEMGYEAYEYFLQDMVTNDGVRYILFSYCTIMNGELHDREYFYLLLRLENNDLIPSWTDKDVIYKTSYADNVFTVKIGDYPDEYKIDISSKVDYENKQFERFKPKSVADIFNGPSFAICYDVHFDSNNQIVTNFICNNADYMFYITSIQLVWSLKNGEVQLDQCSLVNEYPG